MPTKLRPVPAVYSVFVSTVLKTTVSLAAPSCAKVSVVPSKVKPVTDSFPITLSKSNAALAATAAVTSASVAKLGSALNSVPTKLRPVPAVYSVFVSTPAVISANGTDTVFPFSILISKSVPFTSKSNKSCSSVLSK